MFGLKNVAFAFVLRFVRNTSDRPYLSHVFIVTTVLVMRIDPNSSLYAVLFEVTWLTCSVSWQLTDEELSFAPRLVEPVQPAKQRQKHRPTVSQQVTTPVVPNAPPTFADESDSDAGIKDDDEEYTGEHQLTRLRRGKQVNAILHIEKLMPNSINRLTLRDLLRTAL
jgi:hypothetical protein